MSFDVIVVGGGLAGSTVAAQVARDGARVLVLEREARFTDRVRGENVLPWGVAAARRLGILDALLAAGAHRTRWWMTYAGGHVVNERDLEATTPGHDATVNIYHPDMQEALLQRAVSAGVEVKRGATVTGVAVGPARAPEVTYLDAGGQRTERARLVICADGRTSAARGWCGFATMRDPELLAIAGTIVEGTPVPERATHLFFGPGVASLFAPLGHRRARVYFVYPGVSGRRGLTGHRRFRDFLDACRSAGVPPAWLSEVVQAGPLAEFDCADRWVDAPARDGVALVGDAAASSDPAWGCGLSLTLLDVEQLTACLRATDDRDAALERYAREHDAHYGALRRILAWMTELAWTPGAAAEERRRRVLPRMFEHPPGFPDPVGLGPHGPSDEQARRLVLGEQASAAPAPGAAEPQPSPM